MVWRQVVVMAELLESSVSKLVGSWVGQSVECLVAEKVVVKVECWVGVTVELMDGRKVVQRVVMMAAKWVAVMDT